MHRLITAALVLPLALAACAEEAPPPADEGASVDVAAEAEATAARVPFCLPGETRVCTLGPPPVCHCQ